MPDYSKSKIYKIVCNITGLIYIGSTSQPLCRRIQDHKYDYKDYLNKKSYSSCLTSFKILENNNYNIILVEDFPCERKEQLLARERFWIENTKCVNKMVPTRTKKEWREDHKEEIKQYRENNKEKIKQYLEEHKEKIKEYQKEYHEKNKEEIKKGKSEYYFKNKEKIIKKQKEYKNEWRENNKEKIKEYNKQRYLKNKEKTKPPENLI